MLKLIKDPKFPLAVFIAAAITSLLVFFLLYLVLSMSFGPVNTKESESEKEFNQRYYLKNVPEARDPFITVNPNMSQLLNGPIIGPSDPYIGNPEAKVTITVFSDFSCEYCGNQESILKNMVKRYGQKVNLLWKDYPEDDPDSYSYKAAIAARCAQVQGKFWEYHDELYKNYDYNNDVFLDLAKNIALDADAFDSCVTTLAVKELVDSNISEAIALELPGIPFIYVNDQQLFGEVNEAELGQVIEIEIKKTQK